MLLELYSLTWQLMEELRIREPPAGEAEPLLKRVSPHPILAHCLDGTLRAGLALAAIELLHRLDTLRYVRI